jgi:hypothetical protein
VWQIFLVHIGKLLLQVWIVKVDLGAIEEQYCYIGRGIPKPSLLLCFKEKKLMPYIS